MPFVVFCVGEIGCEDTFIIGPDHTLVIDIVKHIIRVLINCWHCIDNQEPNAYVPRH